MRVVLDTGAFFRPALLAAFEVDPVVAVVPTIVLAERRRQLAHAGRDDSPFVEFVTDGRFIVEAFEAEHALRMSVFDDETWKRHARDIMIAAHVREGDVLWTTNPRDFLALGLSPDQVRAV